MSGLPPADPTERPTNYREAKRRQERQHVVAAVLVLVGGGAGLIALIYGPIAALSALPWLGLGGAGILGLYGLMVLLERWANQER